MNTSNGVDKQTLLQKIQSAQIAEELKDKLKGMVDQAAEASPELVKKIVDALDADSQEALETIAKADIEAAGKEADKQIAGLQKEASDFVKDINKQADDLEKDSLRQQIQK